MNIQKKSLILMVDDNPQNLQVLASLLGGSYKIAVATSGAEALNFVKIKKYPDLILLDITMPEIDGFEVCRRLKSSPLTKNIPVIFLSARTDTEDIIKGFKAGAVDYITKPFRKEELMVRAGTHLRLKNSEEKLRQALKESGAEKKAAEKATKFKSEFLARMSHEIRTPMNAVIGLTHLALKADTMIRQDDYLLKIQSEAHSLLGVINDILDFSKIEAGKLELESTCFCLDDVIKELSDLMNVKADEKKIRLRFNINNNIPRILNGDPVRLKQILINLINNALKFTDRGEIAVNAAVLEKHKEDRIILRFSVKDTGIGIAPEAMGKFFESFTQADGSITRKYGGTGLGLAICKNLTEMMGGKMYAESTPDQGSIFSFTAGFGCPDDDNDNYMDLSEEIRENVKKGHTEESVKQLHSFKSTAGQIGAEDLYAAAAALEDSLRENRVEEHLLTDFEKKIEQVMISLKTIRDFADA